MNSYYKRKWIASIEITYIILILMVKLEYKLTEIKKDKSMIKIIKFKGLINFVIMIQIKLVFKKLIY